MSQVIADPQGRFVIVIGNLYGYPITLANIYAPNVDDEQFIATFLAKLPNMNSHQFDNRQGFQIGLRPQPRYPQTTLKQLYLNLQGEFTHFATYGKRI